MCTCVQVPRRLGTLGPQELKRRYRFINILKFFHLKIGKLFPLSVITAYSENIAGSQFGEVYIQQEDLTED